VEVLGERLVVAADPALFDDFAALLEEAGALDAPPGPEPAAWQG
jgi:hypothetical protein